jgi:hypothetical protein
MSGDQGLLAHHLAPVGRADTLFSDDAVALIHQTSRGLPARSTTSPFNPGPALRVHRHTLLAPATDASHVQLEVGLTHASDRKARCVPEHDARRYASTRHQHAGGVPSSLRSQPGSQPGSSHGR